MKIWKVEPSGDVTSLDVPSRDVVARACEIIGAPIDLTRVVWAGKKTQMAVDDQGHRKGLPVNEIATQAYWEACRPGTDFQMVGITVIFDNPLD